MARVHRVEKCRKTPGKCGKCGNKIKKGQPYTWTKPRYGTKKVRCKTCPFRRSDLTTSKMSEAYAALDQEDQERVRSLAAILRVADALDHDHKQRVNAVRAKERGSELKLRVSTRGDVSLDAWSLKDKGDLFENQFGLKPVVVT